MNDLLEGAKVWQKGWFRQLRANLDNHGLKTKCHQDNWLHNKTTKLKITDGRDFKANTTGKRSQKVQCANENCDRMFHSKKEMNRHLRFEIITQLSVQISDRGEIDKGIESIEGIEITAEIP